MFIPACSGGTFFIIHCKFRISFPNGNILTLHTDLSWLNIEMSGENKYLVVKF